MECSSECSCGGGTSRREVLTAAMAAAVVAPLLARTAAAADTQPAMADDAWVKTVKPDELKENVSHPIPGTHPIALMRNGTTVIALSPKCTHKGCTVKQAAGAPSFICPCHGAEFDLTGANLQGPHKPPATAAATLKPLARYALRLNSDGIIEVNTSAAVDADAKDGMLTLPA